MMPSSYSGDGPRAPVRDTIETFAAATMASALSLASNRMKAETSDDRGSPDMAVLIEKVAQVRDKNAFRQLFEHFAPRLKAFVMRLGTDAGSAEEIAQETMVRVWQKAEQFDPARAAASTWVFTIARNQRIDQIRRATRPEPDFNDPAFVPDPEPAAFDVVASGQQADLLKSVIEGLPAEQQEVLRLAFFEDKTHGAVADELGVPLGTVKSRIRLAMKRMRAELGDSV
jgi:RNA polymerase sigma-70 factor (ECF subfamily)